MFFRAIFLLLSLLGLASFLECSSKLPEKPVEFVVLVPSYNNEKWCVQNLESIANQTYPHWSMYYINDCSSDRTGQIVDEFVKARGLENKCKIVHNTERKLAMRNLYEGIHDIDPTKVVVICDGDDWFANNSVLERLAKTYSNKRIWMTYGNYQTWPEFRGSICDEIPKKVKKNQLFRSYKWVSSHLRTFYAKLFQQIKKEDFQWKEGAFFPMTYDLAIMFPMLEMASKRHYRFLSDVLYIYNISNPINDFKVNLQLQEEIERYIRSRPSYEPLETLF